MTDTPDDGWPEKYRDPRDRPQPDVLRVTAEGVDHTREQALAAADAVDDGAEQPAVVSFATVEELWGVFTSRRLELLGVLVAAEGAAESISALAETLDRDYRTVHDDVTRLADYGLLFIVDDGQAKRPYVPYERIHLDVELVGAESSDEPAPA